ncbi:hypothetical protein PBAL39_09921 [Pedobacter sp. BAL39]|uniref:DUF4350 domain-containing protein n=1 Tax=Pedobacter sp. BAL39 TaxID=391596 RepID=UPI000155A1E4|nr:DUF4350 domain-containing protein [Pedobacter sp. BAL39]EDM37452.1 hypothetical protein PBAL39_09921 [Pedobacter sp. BAL39]
MKGIRMYFIGSAVILVIYLIAQYYRPKPVDWTSSYLKEDKIPFGLYVLHEELDVLFPKTVVHVSRKPVYNTLKSAGYKDAGYLLITGSVKMDQLDYQELTKFMQQGNSVFIAAADLGKTLKDTLGLDVYGTFYEGKTGLNFENPVLKNDKSYLFNKGIGDAYFSRIDSSRATVLGRNTAGEINFLKYSYGKGALYVMPNPQVFSNYCLLGKPGADYAVKALSYLPKGKVLIWDEYSTKGSIENSSVLRVIFKHDALRWAYYLSLFSLLAFVFFEMKRRQRIIPVLEPLQNSSLEFVKLIGKLYYQRRDNRDIAQKKISYFMDFLRSRYRIKLTTADLAMQEELIHKSGVPQETVNGLFSVIRNIDKEYQVSDESLILLNQLIEKFYKQAQ